MNAIVDLRQMSVPEKLQLMEALWRDLSQTDHDLVSPEWHGAVLLERDRKLASGEDGLIDWETGKRQLRSRLQ